MIFNDIPDLKLGNLDVIAVQFNNQCIWTRSKTPSYKEFLLSHTQTQNSNLILYNPNNKPVNNFAYSQIEIHRTLGRLSHELDEIPNYVNDMNINNIIDNNYHIFRVYFIYPTPVNNIVINNNLDLTTSMEISNIQENVSLSIYDSSMQLISQISPILINLQQYYFNLSNEVANNQNYYIISLNFSYQIDYDTTNENEHNQFINEKIIEIKNFLKNCNPKSATQLTTVEKLNQTPKQDFKTIMQRLIAYAPGAVLNKFHLGCAAYRNENLIRNNLTFATLTLNFYIPIAATPYINGIRLSNLSTSNNSYAYGLRYYSPSLNRIYRDAPDASVIDAIDFENDTIPDNLYINYTSTNYNAKYDKFTTTFEIQTFDKTIADNLKQNEYVSSQIDNIDFIIDLTQDISWTDIASGSYGGYMNGSYSQYNNSNELEQIKIYNQSGTFLSNNVSNVKWTQRYSSFQIDHITTDQNTIINPSNCLYTFTFNKLFPEYFIDNDGNQYHLTGIRVSNSSNGISKTISYSPKLQYYYAIPAIYSFDSQSEEIFSMTYEELSQQSFPFSINFFSKQNPYGNSTPVLAICYDCSNYNGNPSSAVDNFLHYYLFSKEENSNPTAFPAEYSSYFNGFSYSLKNMSTTTSLMAPQYLISTLSVLANPIAEYNITEIPINNNLLPTQEVHCVRSYSTLRPIFSRPNNIEENTNWTLFSNSIDINNNQIIEGELPIANQESYPITITNETNQIDYNTENVWGQLNKNFSHMIINPSHNPNNPERQEVSMYKYYYHIFLGYYDRNKYITIQPNTFYLFTTPKNIKKKTIPFLLAKDIPTIYCTNNTFFDIDQRNSYDNLFYYYNPVTMQPEQLDYTNLKTIKKMLFSYWGSISLYNPILFYSGECSYFSLMIDTFDPDIMETQSTGYLQKIILK